MSINVSRWLRWVGVMALVGLLTACEALQLQPTVTVTPTRAVSGPTLAPSPVVRGEVPTPVSGFFGQNDPTAAAMPSDGDLPPIPLGTVGPGGVSQPIQLPAVDGTLLRGTLYSDTAERRPGVVLLAPNSADWLDLPLRLQAAGFTVLTMDVGMIRTLDDFTGILRAFSDVGTVDPAGIGVVGAEAGADVALTGCAADLLCDAVGLITPVGGEALRLAVQGFNPRPMLLVAGQGDAAGIGVITLLEQVAQTSTIETSTDASRGAGLIQMNPGVADRLVEWLRTQL